MSKSGERISRASSQRVVLVTGAAQGIGLQIAKRMAEEGHQVLLVDRQEEVVRQANLLRDDGLQAKAFVADLSAEADVQRLLAMVLAEFSAVDVLVNNAGIVMRRANESSVKIEDVPIQEWRTMMDVNLLAPVQLIQGLVPGMESRQWGRIINLSSISARHFTDQSTMHYSASKTALQSLSRILAGRLGQYGITVNCIAPGIVETPMVEQNLGAFQELAKRIPLRRLGRSDDIAAAVSFLASDDASYITGSTLDVNGGAFMG